MASGIINNFLSVLLLCSLSYWWKVVSVETLASEERKHMETLASEERKHKAALASKQCMCVRKEASVASEETPNKVNSKLQPTLLTKTSKGNDMTRSTDTTIESSHPPLSNDTRQATDDGSAIVTALRSVEVSTPVAPWISPVGPRSVVVQGEGFELIRKKLLYLEEIEPEIHCPWHFIAFNTPPQQRTGQQIALPANLRKKVLNYYGLSALTETRNRGKRGRCMITGLEGNGMQVSMMHLLPKGLPLRVANYWIGVFMMEGSTQDLQNHALHGLRNVIPCCKGIEMLFDQGKACIIPTRDSKKATLRVLHEESLNNLVYVCESNDNVPKVRDFNGHTFDFPTKNRPYTRILLKHASCALEHATKMGWIQETLELPEAKQVSPLKNDLLILHNATESSQCHPDQLEDDLTVNTGLH